MFGARVCRAYSAAVEAGDLLRNKHPNHELLRLVRKEDPNLDHTLTEIIGRFWDGQFLEEPSVNAIHEACYEKLSEAMLKAAAEPLAISVGVKAISLDRGRSFNAFEVQTGDTGEYGCTEHLFGSEAEALAFVAGVKNLAGFAGVSLRFCGMYPVEDGNPF